MFRLKILCAAIALSLSGAAGCIDPTESDAVGTWYAGDSTRLVFMPGGRWEATGFDWTKVLDKSTVRQLNLQGDCTGEWRLIPDIYGSGTPIMEITVKTEPEYTTVFHMEFSGQGFWVSSRPYDLEISNEECNSPLFRRVQTGTNTPE